VCQQGSFPGAQGLFEIEIMKNIQCGGNGWEAGGAATDCNILQHTATHCNSGAIKLEGGCWTHIT